MKLDTQLTRSTENPFNAEIDVLIIAVEEEILDSSVAAEFDNRLGGRFKAAIANGSVSKDALKTSLWHAPEKITARVVVTIGVGKELSARALYRAAASAIKQACTKPYEKIGIAGFPTQQDQKLVDSIAIGCLTGAIGQDLYRDKKNLVPPKQIVWFHQEDLDLSRGEAIATGIAMTRNLVNQAPNHMYPASFVDQTLEQLAGTSLQSEVWDEHRLKAERCETMLAVGRRPTSHQGFCS